MADRRRCGQVGVKFSCSSVFPENSAFRELSAQSREVLSRVTLPQQLRALRDGTTLPDLYGLVGTHPLRWDHTGWEQVQPMPVCSSLTASAIPSSTRPSAPPNGTTTGPTSHPTDKNRSAREEISTL